VQEREIAAGAVMRSEALRGAALADMSPSERRRARRLGRILDDPDGRALLFALTDEVVARR